MFGEREESGGGDGGARYHWVQYEIAAAGSYVLAIVDTVPEPMALVSIHAVGLPLARVTRWGGGLDFGRGCSVEQFRALLAKRPYQVAAHSRFEMELLVLGRPDVGARLLQTWRLAGYPPLSNCNPAA